MQQTGQTKHRENQTKQRSGPRTDGGCDCCSPLDATVRISLGILFKRIIWHICAWVLFLFFLFVVLLLHYFALVYVFLLGLSGWHWNA